MTIPDPHALAQPWCRLLGELARFAPPRLGLVPAGDDIELLADHLRNLMDALEPYIEAVGAIADHATPHTIDQSVFKGVLHDSFSDAIGELTKTAERMRDSEREQAADPRGFEKASWLGVD